MIDDCRDPSRRVIPEFETYRRFIKDDLQVRLLALLLLVAGCLMIGASLVHIVR